SLYFQYTPTTQLYTFPYTTLFRSNKTKEDWDNYGVEYSESVEEIGKMIVEATRDFMKSAPVIAIVLEGTQAVEIVRKMVGKTGRSEEHTSELQSRENLVCRLLLEK